MMTIIQEKCPNCGRAIKDHTRWQKEACGRALSAGSMAIAANKAHCEHDLINLFG